jgi:hypothetical protein
MFYMGSRPNNEVKNLPHKWLIQVLQCLARLRYPVLHGALHLSTENASTDMFNEYICTMYHERYICTMDQTAGLRAIDDKRPALLKKRHAEQQGVPKALFLLADACRT